MGLRFGLELGSELELGLEFRVRVRVEMRVGSRVEVGLGDGHLGSALTDRTGIRSPRVRLLRLAR